MRVFQFQGVPGRLLSSLLSVALVLPGAMVLGVVAAPPAAADPLPVIQITKAGPAQILVGDTATYTLTATNPPVTTTNPVQVPQYNLSFRDVLPPGVVYVGPTTPSSAGQPDVFPETLDPDDPDAFQTLVWSNIADLQINSSAEISFVVRAEKDPLPVSSTFTNQADAYTNSDARYVPKFDTEGVVVATSYTASATATTTSTGVTAFRIDKASSPTPEGELLRGVHDQVATYTLKVTNNPSFATNDIEIRDYLPAGLEFLGCGTVDNTPPSALYPAGPANPSIGLEYPGAPPLTATLLVPACQVPVSVETVEDPPRDGGRTFPEGVYTKVTWRIGDFDPRDVMEIVYRAGIPQRVNTMTWTNGAPATSGDGTFENQPPQTANLDNNSEGSTRETTTEQSLTNIVVGDGLYTGPVEGQAGDGPFPVASSTDHEVTAEDLDMQKAVDPPTFEAGEIATYTLTLRTSEYVTAAGIVVTDVMPNGVCPLWATADPAPVIVGSLPLPADCGTALPAGSDPTGATLASVERNEDGTFTLVFAPVSAGANGTITITYQGRMRTEYTGGSLAGQPTSSGDTYTNRVSLVGTTDIRTDIDVNAPEPDGTGTVSDNSSATQSSTQPVIDKRIKPNVSGALGYQCSEGNTKEGPGLPTPGSPVTVTGAAEYVNPPAPPLTGTDVDRFTFRNGSIACFLLRVEFPSQSQTKNPVVTDFLPAGTSYVANSAVVTANSSLKPPGDVSFAPSSDPTGPLVWNVGVTSGGNRFAPKGAVFEVVFAVSIDGAAAGSTPDIVGNLMKFRSENSAGQAISLRDQLDFQVAPLPPVSLVKGIASITPAVPSDPATENVNLPPAEPTNVDGRNVRDGDVVKFRIDVTNTSDSLGAFASSVRTLDIWDLLPAGVPCEQVVSGSVDPASGPGVTFTCVTLGDTGNASTTNRSLLRWQFDSSDVPGAIAAGASKTLTYDFTVPDNVSVATVLTDNAGVRSYQAFTNLPNQAATYYPIDNIDPSVPIADRDAPRADDPSNVVVANVALTKIGTTSITEDNNNAPNQATIGELVTYTVTATVPYGTSVYQGVLTDTLPTGLTYVSSAADYSVDAGATWSATLPTGTVLANGGQLVTLTLPTSYTAAATATANHVFRLTITARVSTLSENAQGVVRTNTASFLSKASAATDALTVTAPTPASYPVTIVEPSPTLTKEADRTTVAAGDVVTYTLTASNASGRPPLHDSWVVDCLPAGLAFGGYLPAGRTDVLAPVAGTGTNGCTSTETRLAWQPTSPNPTTPPSTLNPGTLLAGPANAATLEYTATVSTASAGLSSYTNKALLSGGTLQDGAAGPQTPPNPLERTYSTPATATITVRGAATVKTVTPASATIGETATWTIRVVVPPDINFYRAAVIDEVLPGIDLTSIATTSVDCQTVAPNPSCAVGSKDLTPSSPGPRGGTLIGWYLGDVTAAPYAREVVVTYTGKVANVAGPPLSPVRGNALLDYASGRWFTSPTGPIPTSAGALFDRSTNEDDATVTVKEPLVSISKAVSDATPDPGQDIRYTVTATNGSEANVSTAYNVTIKDVVPVGVVVNPSTISDGGSLTPLPAPADPALGGGTITWPAIPSLLVGTSNSKTFTYWAKLAPSQSLNASGKRNTASVSGYNSLSDGTGRQYIGPSANRTVTPQFPRVTPAKTTPNGEIAYVGTPFTWQITLTNNGASRAYGVDAVDTLPKNWTYTATSSVVVAGTPVSPAPQPALGVTGAGNQTLAWTNLGAINAPVPGNPGTPGQTIVITFTATPQPGALADPGTGASIAHTNTVATTAEDATGAQSRCGAATQPSTSPCTPQVPYNDGPFPANARIHRADLVLEKDHVGTPVAGRSFDWTIKVTNNGPDTAVGPFTVTDAVQAPMTFADDSGDGWNCSAVDAAVTCTRSNAADTLAAGASFPLITLRVTIPSDTPTPTTLTNTASVTGRTYDPTPGNNTDTDSVPLTTSADLAIEKGRSEPLEAGRDVTYTLSVSNLGSSTSRATITVTDAVPVGTTFVSASGTGWACPTDNAAITSITCTRGSDLLAGKAAPQITVVLRIGSGFTGDLTNTAVVTGTTPDPVPGNNTSSVTGTVKRLADVAIEKTHAGTDEPAFKGDFTPGTTNNSYLFTVTNFGPADAAAPVVVEDTLPEHLSYTGTKSDISGTWTCVADPATTPTAPIRQKVTCTLTGGLALGQTRAVRIGIAAATTAPADGKFTNTATVTSGTKDPNEGNNSSTDNTAFTSSADLAIAKTPKTQTVLAGEDVTWTLTVTNKGPSNSAGPTTVTDVLPAGTTFVSAGGDGWKPCTLVDQTITCEHPDGVASGGSLPPITVVAAVSASAGPATLVNKASVDGPTGDPDLTNNTTEASVTVADEADLGIVKTFTGTSPVPAGATTTFSLAVSNAGPSDADGVIVGDTLPAGLTLVNAAGDGWTCVVAGQVLSCSRPTLAAKTSAPLIAQTVRVNSGYPPATITNTATVSSATKDVNPDNDSSSDKFQVTASADLILTKSHDKDASAVAGEEFTFDLVVRNAGPSDAQLPIVVRDTLPAGLSYVSNGPDWTCTTTGTPAVDEVVECTLDGGEALIAGTTAPALALTTLIAADTDPGELTNDAEATSPTPDPNEANNKAKDTVDVTTLSDLVVTKSHTGPVVVGGMVAFTLGVSNTGPSEARSVRMVDTLPTGLTYVAAVGTDWTCDSAGQVVTCDLADPLAPLAAAPPISVTVTVGPSAYPKVENVVVGSTITPESTTKNNTATDPLTVPPLVDLAIDKAHRGSFTVGTNGTYTLTVTNNGPTDDPGPQTITDTLPTGLTYVSGTGADWSCDAAGQAVTCTRPANLVVGATSIVTLIVGVGPAAAPSVVNTATVTTPSTETSTLNNTDSDATTVIPVSVLTIVKDAAEVDGDQVTYLITIGNTGPNATTAPIVVSDPLPSGLEFVSVSGDGWTCTEGQVVTCTYDASLPVGGSASFELMTRLTADPGAEVENVASVVGGNPDGGVVSDDAVVVTPDKPGGDSSSGGLADTGAAVGSLGLFALAMLVPGWAAVMSSRSRRQH